MYKFFNLLLVSLTFTMACSVPNNDSGDASEETAVEATTAAEGNPAEEAFQQQYPEATEVEWNEDSNGYLEANFELNGEKYRADYTREGEWVETESSIDADELPQVIQDRLKNEFDADEITEVERVEHPQKGIFYDVEFKRKGSNKDVEFNEQGEVIN